MAEATYTYQPDYAVSPGEILAERLSVWGMSQAEFARRCGRTPKLISQIIAGKAPIEPDTALQFEKVSDIDARIWLGIETDYQLYRRRQAEKQRLAESVEWAGKFPISELVKRKLMNRAPSKEDAVANLLSFFGVASVEAWQNRQASLQVCYRHSAAFDSNEAALATWLRLGELEAEGRECAEYNEARFRRALRKIRGLTADTSGESLEEACSLCRESGVVLAIIKPPPRIALSGVARWLAPGKALIQLSARYMSDDHLWFSFFHEAAHILQDSKKATFVHDKSHKSDKITEADVAADRWASDFLIPGDAWDSFTTASGFNQSNVLEFARKQGIAPGIIVGRLQHENRLPWKSSLNQLKVRLLWRENPSG